MTPSLVCLQLQTVFQRDNESLSSLISTLFGSAVDFLNVFKSRVVSRFTLDMSNLVSAISKCVYVRNLHLSPQCFPLGILRHISVFKPRRLSR